MTQTGEAATLSSAEVERLRRAIVDAWCSTLDVPAPPDEREGFLDAGGDSMDAIRLLQEVRETTGYRVSPRNLVANAPLATVLAEVQVIA